MSISVRTLSSEIHWAPGFATKTGPQRPPLGPWLWERNLLVKYKTFLAEITKSNKQTSKKASTTTRYPGPWDGYLVITGYQRTCPNNVQGKQYRVLVLNAKVQRGLDGSAKGTCLDRFLSDSSSWLVKEFWFSSPVGNTNASTNWRAILERCSKRACTSGNLFACIGIVTKLVSFVHVHLHYICKL